MVAESEADPSTEQATREEPVSSAQRWTSERGRARRRLGVSCPKAYLKELESTGFQ